MSSKSASGKNGKGGRDDHDDHPGRGRDNRGDVIIGSKGGDTLSGTEGNDVINGRAGGDTIYGRGGNDIIHGGKGNDVIDGGAGNDRLYGGKGDDTLIGGSGNDHLDGGSGRDTAVFSGNFADYTIKFSNKRNRCDNDDDTVTVARKASGPDGTDTLKNVEVLQFDDGYYQNGVFYPTSNQAPTAVADSASAIEAGGVENGTPGVNPSGNVLDNDTDPDAGDSKAVTTTGNFPGTYGTLTLDASGSYTYVLDNTNNLVQSLRTASDTLTETFHYTMADAAGAASASTLTITIHGSNDSPLAVPDTASATEAGGVANGTAGVDPTGNVLDNDTDVDAGDSKTVTTTGALSGAYGTLALNADGSYSYAVNNANTAVQALRSAADFLSDNISYTMTDAGGATSESFLAVTIYGSNDAPEALDGTAVGTGVVTGQATANDVDTPAADLSYGVAVQGLYGFVVMATDGSFTYTPNVVGSSGTDSFSFTVSDGEFTDDGTIEVTFGSDNIAPVAESARFFVSEDAALVSGQLHASDADGDTLTYSLAVQAGSGFASVSSTGLFTYDANDGFLGPDSATFRVVDGFGGEDTALVSIEVFAATDNLIGSALDDYLIAGSADMELAGLAGADYLIGGGGINTASYADSTAAVTVDLSNTGAQLGGDAQGDILSSIERVTGSAHNDVLTGDDGVNVLDGGDGADLLVGGMGEDGLIGGAGNDTLIGGDGLDGLLGGLGSDTLTGGSDGPDFFGYFNAAGDTIADLGGDVITDFSTAEGDALLLEDVLQNYTPGDDLSAFIQLDDNGTNTTVNVDADGGGDDFAALVTLLGVTGVSLEDLLNGGNLLISSSGPTV